MNLPDTSTINFLNKVLLILSELAPDNRFCSINSLIDQCRAIATGSEIADYNKIIEICNGAGLIKIKSSEIQISVLGLKLLSANKERFFEITESQKQIIVERIVFRGKWNIYARELFELFELNYTTDQYEFSKTEQSFPYHLISVEHLFKHLGILSETKDTTTVSKQYSQHVYELTADSKGLAEVELEKMLAENRKLGAKAEIAVVAFEKRRLLKLGKPVQAEFVRRISTSNVSAGYDVESFDGDTDSIFPNRFIEVKATTKDRLRFYWSNNEKNVAAKKKKLYWIYVMVEFRENKPNECLPIMIQDPNSKIPTTAFLSMDANEYIVQEIAEMELDENILGDVRWLNIK